LQNVISKQTVQLCKTREVSFDHNDVLSMLNNYRLPSTIKLYLPSVDQLYCKQHTNELCKLFKQYNNDTCSIKHNNPQIQTTKSQHPKMN